MPRRDVIHDAVRNALIKAGWTITHDPYTVRLGGDEVHIDLGAELPLAAERGTEQIAVEIKSFLEPSKLNAFQQALGQYNIYSTVLEETDPQRQLYLALSRAVYEELAESETFRLTVRRFGVRFIVVDIRAEEIAQWIPEITIAN